jgi:N-acetylglucosaminyldiphosphoundecaprenol N-acetyl-beta-D-mannosaminyltransferase
VQSADLVVADGMPLIWTSWIMGDPLPERVCGSNLVWSMAERGAAHGFSIFLLGGGDPGTAERSAKILQQRYPGLRVAGTHFPPFGFESSPDEIQAVISKLEQTGPDVVYVALGFPKAERLIHQLRGQFPSAGGSGWASA